MLLAEERYSRIVTILKERGFAKVDDLAQMLKVSNMTIRRDLEKCQVNGLLHRCHGGAVLAGGTRQEICYEDKQGEHTELKRELAKRAAGFVEEGMAVFIDSGTTAFEIARQIQNIPRITIAADDIHTLYSLLNSNAELISIGGVIQKKTGSAMGHFSEQMLEQMHFDIAFFGAYSIDTNFFVMTPTPEKMLFKRHVMEHSNFHYLVADHSKFAKKALYSINSLSDYSGVITDYEFNPSEYSLAAEQKINILPVRLPGRENREGEPGA